MPQIKCLKWVIVVFIIFSVYTNVITSFCSQEINYFENGLRLNGESIQVIEDETIIIRGNLELTDQAYLRIINCNLSIHWYPGDNSQQILVSENSKLELINSTLHLNVDLTPNYNTNGKLRVSENGSLMVKNSTITCSSNMWLVFEDNSSLTFIESSCFGNAPGSSAHWSIEDMLPEGVFREYYDDYRFSFEDSSTITIEKSMLGSVNVYQNSSCIIKNSEIMLLDTLSSTETVVSNSKIKVLLASMTDRNFEFTGNIEGYHEEWSSSSFFGPENMNNLRLRESSFGNMWLTLANCTSLIHDAQLFYISTYYGSITVSDSNIKFLKLGDFKPNVLDSTIEYVIGTTVDEPVIISGSTIGFLGLSGQMKVEAEIYNATIEDCRINNFFMPDIVNVKFDNVRITDLWLNPVDQFDIHFKDSSVNGEITLLSFLKSNENATIIGSVSFQGASLQHYGNTALTREYQVQVIKDGQPQSGVSVQLLQKGETWRSFTTDEYGKTQFKIKWVDYSKQDYFLDFNPNNLTDTIIISALGSEEELSLLSNSPIILEAASPSKLLNPLTGIILLTLFGTSLFLLKKRVLH